MHYFGKKLIQLNRYIDDVQKGNQNLALGSPKMEWALIRDGSKQKMPKH